ncbi:hypothetical protein ACUXS6_005670, partial [Ralstonia pickettii]
APVAIDALATLIPSASNAAPINADFFRMFIAFSFFKLKQDTASHGSVEG